MSSQSPTRTPPTPDQARAQTHQQEIDSAVRVALAQQAIFFQQQQLTQQQAIDSAVQAALAVAQQAAGSTRPQVTVTDAPRIGGVNDNVAWTGGSNLQRLSDAGNISCFRPTAFRDRQRMEENVKKGLPEDRRLDLDEKKITPMVFIKEFRRLVESNGFDTVFRVVNSSGAEIYLLTHWGKLTIEQVQAWVKKLQEGGAPWPGDSSKMQACRHDIKNLEFSAEAFRNSVGPQLYNQLESQSKMNCSGPEYFKLATMKMSGTSPQAIRMMANALDVDLCLKNENFEDVTNFSLKVRRLVTELLGSGNPPDDLAFLTAKCYGKSTDERFRAFANNITTRESGLMIALNAEPVIQELVTHYENRYSAKDWPPKFDATKSPKESQEDVLKGMMAKGLSQISQAVMQQNLGNGGGGGGGSALTQGCFNCGGDHYKIHCPKLQGGGGGGFRVPLAAWRKIAPAAGEPTTKVVEGVAYSHCQTCLQGAGLWTQGKGQHSTAEHKAGYRKSKTGQGTGTVSGHLGRAGGDASGLDFVDGSLSERVGFFGTVVPLKGPGGRD
jgi:hypothetical protein